MWPLLATRGLFTGCIVLLYPHRRKQKVAWILVYSHNASVIRSKRTAVYVSWLRTSDIETTLGTHNKGKVALVYIIQTHRGSKGITPLILNRGIDTGEWSTSGPQCFILERTVPRLSGPQSQGGCFEQHKNLLPLSGIKSRIVQPIHSSPYILGYPDPYWLKNIWGSTWNEILYTVELQLSGCWLSGSPTIRSGFDLRLNLSRIP